MKTIGFFMLAAAMATPVAAQNGENEYYLIQAGDVLAVRVLEDPSLSSQVLVRPDGRISLPIAGSVMAEGRSPERLETVLKSRFAQGFELSPTVTVSVVSVARQDLSTPAEEIETVTYYLLGQVGRPGPITVESDKSLTLLQALSAAGGPAAFAATDRIQLRRTAEDGTQQIILFDYSRIEDGEMVEDIPLEDGDLIFFPERTLF